MTTRVDDGHRRLVPRWRYSKATILGREHEGDPRASREAPRVFSRMGELRQGWSAKRDLASARELVAAAVVDPNPTVACDAAHYILTHEDPNAAELIGSARYVLGERATTDLHPHIANESYSKPINDARRIIARGREGLREYPRNVLRRLDVARAYAILGQGEAAWRQMRIALALAPADRVVLRLAARLLVHLGRKEQAHLLLVTSPRTRRDPWLMATEIALAAILGVSPQSAERGRKLIVEAGLPLGHLTELAGSLGSVLSASGDHKRARKLLTLSLEDPNDNSLAQAEWLAQHDVGIRDRLAEGPIVIPGSMEAQCLRAMSERRWEDAMCHSREWHFDEPFSSRPATAGSFIAASILQRYDDAVEIAETGLRVDPDDDLLRNNLAFALARKGDTFEAAAHLAMLAHSPRRRIMEFTYLATRGLVRFQLGDRMAGRLDYMDAVRRADSWNSRVQVLASWAETEVRSKTELSDLLYSRVMEAKRRVTDVGALGVTQSFEKSYAANRAYIAVTPEMKDEAPSQIASMLNNLDLQ